MKSPRAFHLFLLMLSMACGCNQGRPQNITAARMLNPETQTKARRIAESIKVVERLQEFTNIECGRSIHSGIVAKPTEAAIKRVVDEISDRETLVYTAVLAYQIEWPGSADTVCYDEVYEAAFWSIVYRLGDDDCDESVDALAEIMRRIGASDGLASRMNFVLESMAAYKARQLSR